MRTGVASIESTSDAGAVGTSVFARLAVLVVGVAVILDAMTVWMFAAGWSIHTPLGYGAELPALLATDFYGLVAAVVGLTLAVRRPSNIIGLLLCVTALGEASHMLTMYGAAMGIPRAIEPWSTAAGWLSGNLLQPTAGLMIATLMLLFPDGRLVTPRWRFAVILVVSGASLRFLETAVAPGAILYFPAVANPVGAPGDLGRAATLLRSLNVGLWLLCLGLLAAAASLVLRYRTATREVRRQIRWYVLAGTLVVCTILPLMYLFLFVDQGTGVGQGVWVAFFLASALIPIAVGIAVTRYRLYEIDRIVNRTILYGTLTAILAGLFTAGVGVAQRLFVALTGETSDAAIVLATFVVATLYAPLRKALEAKVDRRFRYDKARFGAYRDEVVHVMEVIDPASAADRICTEAVRELDAVGGAVEDRQGQIVATEGTWPVPVALRLALPGGWALVIGPRRDDEPHEPSTLADLSELIDLLARAMRLGPAELRHPVGVDHRHRTGRRSAQPGDVARTVRGR